MYKHVIASLFSACIAFSINAQTAEQFRLSTGDLEGMEETRVGTYLESSLWGYINGGADLYLEYGFKELMAQSFKWMDEPFKLDVYIMKSPEAAFGIFSISRFSCASEGVLGSWDCINPFQVQLAHGNLFISVIALKPTEKSMSIATDIALKVKLKHEAGEFILPAVFNKEGIGAVKSKVKLIAGELAMQNAYSSLEQVFESIQGYKLWVAPVADGDSKKEILVAEFDSADHAISVEEKLKSDSRFVSERKGLRVIMLKGIEENKEDDFIRKIFDSF